jgi:hypothetical protein
MKRRSATVAILSSMCSALAGGANRDAKCWAGTDPSGESRWVPCQPVAEQGPVKARMTTLNLDELGGIRVLCHGHAREITAEEIWETLTSPSDQRYQVP